MCRLLSQYCDVDSFLQTAVPNIHCLVIILILNHFLSNKNGRFLEKNVLPGSGLVGLVSNNGAVYTLPTVHRNVTGFEIN
jgi:hypothetical protein